MNAPRSILTGNDMKMTKIKAIIVIGLLIMIAGCKTPVAKDDGGDLRPPQMNNNSFTNFTPIGQ